MKQKFTYIFAIGLMAFTAVALDLYMFNAPVKAAGIDIKTAKIKYADKIQKLNQQFVKEAVIKGPEIVECTLSRGTRTACFSITVDVSPGDFTPGPWCPRNISDGPDKGGIWLKNGKVYDVDGAFIKNLSSLYDDPKWQVYDPATGDVRYTKNRAECAAAAKPDVEEKFHNYCVECKVEYMPEGSSMTYTIPLEPAETKRPDFRPRAGIGLSFSGAKIETAAPLHAILGAHTIAAFDDCGGHVNLHVGYHVHGITGCLKEYQSTIESHAPIIGYAMDGYPLYTHHDKNGTEPSDLDACRGHHINGLGYHYHVADAGKNEILPCLKAQSGCVSSDPKQACDATKRNHPPQ